MPREPGPSHRLLPLPTPAGHLLSGRSCRKTCCPWPTGLLLCRDHGDEQAVLLVVVGQRFPRAGLMCLVRRPYGTVSVVCRNHDPGCPFRRAGVSSCAMTDACHVMISFAFLPVLLQAMTDRGDATCVHVCALACARGRQVTVTVTVTETETYPHLFCSVSGESSPYPLMMASHLLCVVSSVPSLGRRFCP
jgi:hypothetical protein